MNMSCKIAVDLAELYYEGLLSPETEKAIKTHLGGCPECRAYYQNLKAVRKRKIALPETQFSGDDISETEQRLYLNLSKKMRKRRLWEIIGTSAAIGGGSVMLIIGLLLTRQRKNNFIE